jgi:hypothetical protein
VFLRDFSVNTLLSLFFLGTESGSHASMMTSGAVRSAEDLLAGVDEAFLDVRIRDGVGGDARAASAVRGVFVARVRLRGAILAPGLAFAFLELVPVHKTLGAESEGWDVEEFLEGDRGLGEENRVGRGLCEVSGDGPVRILEADGEVGKEGRLPP